ncbi:MAG TPA: winged helix-turn-helix transcriptional regulator [Thermoplasmata archaeon]|jgi:ArsR family transcriptional regulator|nr:winged helix-turn-helix transcriptional regulator [Thermoplasmata archaeon]
MEKLLKICEALDNRHRLRIIALLAERRKYISELARELGVSRPLLYLHLEKLENAGIIRGYSELNGEGRARKYYELTDFKLHLNAQKIKEVVEGAKDDSDH